MRSSFVSTTHCSSSKAANQTASSVAWENQSSCSTQVQPSSRRRFGTSDRPRFRSMKKVSGLRGLADGFATDGFVDFVSG